MFSGIIDGIGEIRACQDVAGGRVLIVRAPEYWGGTRPGASIAVDGACLTVTQADQQEARFDVITETLRRTTLGRLRPGDRVNLQKSLAVGERIDGHFVQGHVDAAATVAKIEQSAQESIWWFTIEPGPASAQAFASVIPKGSIAIDGVSLTVVEAKDGRFSVALIPTTLRETTIGGKHVGAMVNVETDIIARTVVRYLQSLGGESAAAKGAADNAAMMDLLKREGFA